MFLELCLVLRIVLNNDGSDIVLKNVSVFPCDVADSSWSQTTRAPQTDVSQKTTPQTKKEDSSPGKQIKDANYKSMWVYKPAHESEATAEYELQPVAFRAPHKLTKLAKTYSYGFDPYFSTGYFEPFEKRPKPVTLIGFRKNGLIPRKTIKHSVHKSSEVAELQSPFNEINFWIDGAGDNRAY